MPQLTMPHSRQRGVREMLSSHTKGPPLSPWWGTEAWLEAETAGQEALFGGPGAVVIEPAGPEIGSPTAQGPVSPSLGRPGPRLPHSIPHLAGINATLRVAGTEHLGLDLVPVVVGAVADIIADYGDSGLLEHPSLLAWGCAGKAGRSWGACTPPPLPSQCPPGLLSVPTPSGPTGTGVAQMPLPSPAQSLSKAASQQRTRLTVVLCVAPASHGADLAIHQGLPSSRETHRLDVLCARDHTGLGPCQSAPPRTNLAPAAPAHPSLCSFTITTTEVASYKQQGPTI